MAITFREITNDESAALNRYFKDAAGRWGTGAGAYRNEGWRREFEAVLSDLVPSLALLMSGRTARLSGAASALRFPVRAVN